MKLRQMVGNIHNRLTAWIVPTTSLRLSATSNTCAEVWSPWRDAISSSSVYSRNPMARDTCANALLAKTSRGSLILSPLSGDTRGSATKKQKPSSNNDDFEYLAGVSGFAQPLMRSVVAVVSLSNGSAMADPSQMESWKC